MDNSHEQMDLERRRDSQQWILDYVIKASGREQNFEADGRRFPPAVKSHDMIPRVMYRRGRHKEHLAQQAESLGSPETSVQLYFEASHDYALAQHAIYQDDNAEKIHICSRLRNCYDRIIALNATPIERVEVDLEGQQLSGLLHLVPGSEPRPVVVYCPGMDMTKEAFPHPARNWYLERGMHLLAIDGPGQGESNLRKVRVTADNYEKGANRFIDHLMARPEVDTTQIGITGRSMGSYWAMRVAATDERVSAVATSIANYGSKRHIFERSSPRFKQVFMYMAGVHDEDTFDQLVSKMTLIDVAHKITCPTLMVIGEYDPLTPLDEAEDVFERVAGPKEMWVVEDGFHPLRGLEHFGTLEPDAFLADWLRQALAGRAPRSDGRKVLVQAKGDGPYGEPVRGFTLPERDERVAL